LKIFGPFLLWLVDKVDKNDDWTYFSFNIVCGGRFWVIKGGLIVGNM